MPYNVIFPTETNFPIRLRYVFYFIFSLLIKAFVMFLTFLLFQSNLYVVLARRKGPKNSVHKDLLKTKNPKQKIPRPPAASYGPYDAWVGLSLTVIPKCLKNVIFPKFVVNALISTIKSGNGIFDCYSGAPRKTLGKCRAGSLIHLMLNYVFVQF